MEVENLYSLPFNLDATEWYYKGEGNANLVIALKNERKVVRLPKQEENENTQDARVKASLVYYEKVILPLFSEAYFQQPKLARIKKQQVDNLNKILRDVRPQFRRNKVIKPGYVTVFEDLSLLPSCLITKVSSLTRNVNEKVLDPTQSPVYCVELKPKQGWLAPADRKFEKCSFCLNQYLKLLDNSIQSLSDYCPLDFFSGDKSRMLNAINALLATPQNNVRIFQNGILVFGDRASSSIDEILSGICSNINENQNRDNFSALLFYMLTKNTSHQQDTFPSITTRDIYDKNENFLMKSRVPTESVAKLSALLTNIKPCNFSHVPLTANSILDKILKIQKLDTFGADYVYNYYKSTQMTSVNENSDICQLLNHFPNDLDPIENYLLSTMAKDCSILMAFQKVDNLPSKEDSISIVEDLVKNKYVYQVNIADVDAKPIQCIEKHYKRDNRIVQAALDLIGRK